MKLRIAISSWTILIPSLVLNIGLLAAAVYFLNQLEFYYQQTRSSAGSTHFVNKQSSESVPRFTAVITPAGSHDLQGTPATRP